MKASNGFAVRLKALRSGAGLTQTELAETSNMARSAIAKLEGGVHIPSWDTVQKLAAALGVDCTAFNDQGGKPSDAAPEAAPTKAAAKKRKKGDA